jgi:hypothetical protein
LFESQSLAKKVGIENKVPHGLGWSFLNLLWRKKWHVELLAVFKAAGLFPSFDLLPLYVASHPNMTFFAVMVFFELFLIELCDLDDQSEPGLICLTHVWIPMFQILHYLTWLWWWVFLLFFGYMLINKSINVLDWSIFGSWAWLKHRCISEASWSTCVVPCCKIEIWGCNFHTS